jgi:two-component system, response regulator PdtaR
LELSAVFDTDRTVVERMSPFLQRVLIADPQPAGARLVDDLMRSISRAHTWHAATTEKALKLAATCEPQIIFVELSAGQVDGLRFTRELRRSKLPCRQAPVIMVTSTATAQSILAARDCGVHEFLRKPFSMKDLLRRLEAVTLRQRDWVEGIRYVGPDRRRFNSGDYSGALKRGSDNRETPEQARVVQALRILRVAVAAVEKDPEQALRAILAQSSVIQNAATSQANIKMTKAAAEFYRYVTHAAAYEGKLSKEALEVHARALLEFLPKDASDRHAA